MCKLKEGRFSWVGGVGEMRYRLGIISIVGGILRIDKYP